MPSNEQFTVAAWAFTRLPTGRRTDPVRRIELGTCVRPYATPCVHEHACLRCPFQQVDPDQSPRLVEIRLDIKTLTDGNACVDGMDNSCWS